jgi:hypothetical protein
MSKPARLADMYTMGRKTAGQPPLFESEDKLESEIQAYFDLQCENEEPLTISGLAFYLGFISRQSIYDYKENPKFSYILKKATLFIEHQYESNLSGTTPTGSIFALKNMGWKDKTETELSGELSVKEITGMEIK